MLNTNPPSIKSTYGEMTNKNQISKKTEKKLLKSTPFLGTWDDIPKYCQDNEYIITGYRINFHSIKLLLKSIFIVHNETFNIWSHLIGAIAFIIFFYYSAVFITNVISFSNIDILKEDLDISFERLQSKFLNSTEIQLYFHKLTNLVNSYETALAYLKYLQ